MNIKKTILLRVRLAFLGMLVFSLLVIWQIFQIQTFEGSKWRKMVEEVVFKYMPVKATRGNIYSDNGSLLATSLPFYKMTFDPTVASEEDFDAGIDSLAMMCSRFFGEMSERELKLKFKRYRRENKRYIVISPKKLNYQQKKKLENWPLVRLGRNKGGVVFEKMDKRYMPFGQLCYRTIGFVNEENNGVGLEKSYDSRLGGQDGKTLFQKIAGNNWKPLHDENEIKPVLGYDIQTTININLQDVAEDALYRHLQSHDADYGCVVLMEVATGEIKAIANLGKSPNGGYIEDYNYAVGNQGLTDPGSTFKLASLMALFEDSEMDVTDSVLIGNGEIHFNDKVMKDSKPPHKNYYTIKEVFAKSSNVGTSRLIFDHFGKNPKKYTDLIHSFHLNEPIDFQMKGEAKPYIKDTKDSTWSFLSLPWMSVGYEMKMSPLVMLNFYNAVANNGKMIKPIIVKKVWKGEQVIEEYKTEVVDSKICSQETIEKLKECLVEVVEHGTAKNIYTENYKIAGKTGTAQKIKNGQYTKNYYTSFCGFFPAEKPKYSCIVVIDSPKGFLQYGADVAAPVFKEIADKVYSQDYEMHKDLRKEPILTKSGEFPLLRAGNKEELQYLCNMFGISNHYEGEDEWVAANAVDNAVIWNSRKVIDNLVPNVTGMSLRDALYVLENVGLRVRHTGRGRVDSQSLSPGTRFYKGATVYLNLN
ncbi:MAG: penicillin-binding protein [Cytophagales bacterium]